MLVTSPESTFTVNGLERVLSSSSREILGNFFGADTFALRRGVEIRAKSLTASVKFPHDRHKNMDLWRCQSSGNTETGVRADRQTGMQ
jgi:hypothetical protein